MDRDEDIAQQLRDASADRELMTKIHLAVEDELIDLRDRGILTPNRNGLTIFTKEGEPSPVIRMGTRQAIVFILQALAEHYDTAEGFPTLCLPVRHKKSSAEGYVIRSTTDPGKLLVRWGKDGAPLSEVPAAELEFIAIADMTEEG